jgi:hypothetical protein
MSSFHSSRFFHIYGILAIFVRLYLAVRIAFQRTSPTRSGPSVTDPRTWNPWLAGRSPRRIPSPRRARTRLAPVRVMAFH